MRFCTLPDDQEACNCFPATCAENDMITKKQLEILRHMSEEVTESKDIHIVNDWGHIINSVIGKFAAKGIHVLSEKDFLCEMNCSPGAKATKGKDKLVALQEKIHHVISDILFDANPGKQAVAEHGVGPGHELTKKTWNDVCSNHTSWLGCDNAPHPVVSSVFPTFPLHVLKLTFSGLTTLLFNEHRHW